MGEVAGAPAGTHPKQQILGLAQRLLQVWAAFVADRRDVAAHPDQLAHCRGVVDNPSVVLDVDGGGNYGHQMAEVVSAADALKSIVERKLVGDRDLVYWLAPLQERQHRLIAPAALLGVEVRRAQEGRYLVERVTVDQDGADYRLLRVDVMWRQTFRVQRSSFVSVAGR